jgi:hypothetical protein
VLYLSHHINLCLQDPGAYGKLGLSDLFEMREECLREFGFSDVYRLDKDKENNLALQVGLGLCGCVWFGVQGREVVGFSRALHPPPVCV